MKRALVCMVVVAAALFAFSGSAQAVPSVSLNGSLYLCMPGYDGTNSRVASLPFTAGTAGVLNANFFSTANAGTDYSNFDLANHNLYLLVHTRGSYYPDVWKVSGATGVGTQVLAGTGGDYGSSNNFAVDASTGNIYITSAKNKSAVYMHDDNHDGDYNDAGEKTLMTGLSVSLWNSVGHDAGERQDAEFYNGWMYFTIGEVWSNDHFITRVQALPGISGNIAADRSSWPTAGLSAEGPQFLTLGDPDGDGKTDLYAQEGYSSGTYSYTLGHWEDSNSDGVFSSSEYIDKVSLGADARDVQLVQDGKHSMIVYLDKNMVVKYVSLFDNGLIDAANKGTLFTTGLAPSNTDYVYLKMDQIAASVPEPATLLLMGTAALGVMGYVRRRRMI